MESVLVGINGTRIGAYMFPDRKRPALCVAKENSITVYGFFQSKEGAEMFMHELAQAVGAVEKITNNSEKLEVQND